MPTVLRVGPYRFFFYSSDGDEPEHIHVESTGNIAKFWLQPVQLESTGGFSQRELAAIDRIIDEHYESLMRAWSDYFQG